MGAMRTAVLAGCLALAGCGQLLGLDDYADGQPASSPTASGGAAGAGTTTSTAGGAGGMGGEGAKGGDGNAGGEGGGGASASSGGGGGAPPVSLVFVTTFGSFSGNFAPGGINDADAACAAAAMNGSLSGTFTAWMSTAGASAGSRLGCPAGGPWALVNGTPVATGCADLTDGTILHAIDVTEVGSVLANGIHVWTGTDANGVGTSIDCEAWTSSMLSDFGTVGFTGATDTSWTRLADNAPCGDGHAIYCFQTAP
jgi:hypothetical protein